MLCPRCTLFSHTHTLHPHKPHPLAFANRIHNSDGARGGGGSSSRSFIGSIALVRCAQIDATASLFPQSGVFLAEIVPSDPNLGERIR